MKETHGRVSVEYSVVGDHQMKQIGSNDAHRLGSATLRLRKLQAEMDAVETAIQLGGLVKLRRGSLNLSLEETANLAGVQIDDVKRLESAECVSAQVAFQILAALRLKCTAYDQ